MYTEPVQSKQKVTLASEPILLITVESALVIKQIYGGFKSDCPRAGAIS